MKYCTRCQAVCEDSEATIHIEPDVNWATEICPNCNTDGELEPLDADWVTEYISVLRNRTDDAKELKRIDALEIAIEYMNEVSVNMRESE